MKEKTTVRSKTSTCLKGFAIGIANIIPGVSGGTLALVLGIYERIIISINSFSFNTVVSIFKVFSFKRKYIQAFKKEMRKVDMPFLLLVLLGIAIAFITFSRVITGLLGTWHEVTYGFFFGLIFASVPVPYSFIRQKTVTVFANILIGIALVVLICVATSNVPDAAAMQTTSGLGLGRAMMIFLAGILSTSAMILPGISGSFVSLLLGQYFYLLQAVSDANLAVLGLYVVGAMIGLKLLAKILDYLFRKFHDGLMAFLTGLAIGSLYVIWPFKNVYVVGGETLYLSNTLPNAFQNYEWLTLGAALMGVALVVLVIKINKVFVKKNAQVMR